jgi:Zn-dependent M16 (insulinase) family peptidase
MVESVLHQLELSQREISGDGFPFGLQLMVHALSPAIHGADPAEAIDIDQALEKLRAQIQEPQFIKSLARELLENRHRVRLVMRPDPNLSAERAAAEAARLAAMKAQMGQAEKQRVVEMAAKLLERQNSQDDPEQLPKVGIDDIPRELEIPGGEERRVDTTPATWFARGTNGLVYQQVVVELPQLDEELRNLLPLFCDVVTEVGSAGRDYLESQALQAAVTGGIGAGVTVRGAVDDLQRHSGYFTLSGKALARNQAPLTALMEETFRTARFDELGRIRELIAQERMHQEQRVTGSGHALAMRAATGGLTPSAALGEQWYGLSAIRTLKALDDGLEDEARLARLAEQFEAIRAALLAAPRQFLLVGEAEQREAMEAALAQRWQAASADNTTPAMLLPAGVGQLAHGWSTSTQVNFCARAYPGVCAEHEDAAALMVLAGFLRNNFLHRAIREQGGAYGGGASFDPDSGALRFFSYRDPRLAETLADFDRSVTWLVENRHEWRLVEEAILGVISSIDKPGSPAGEAKKAFHGKLHGRTPEQRRRFRARILEVREADLKRVAERYLKPELASTAVIGNPTTLEGQQGLEIIKL